MSEIILEAQARTDMGKGASRRLRRLEDKVPAVIYGGDKPAQPVHFLHRKVIKALENEKIYSSVFEIKVDGKSERVILKDLQRHPYKTIVMHMDLQRVSAKDILVKMVPLHFLHEEDAKGVKAGGIVNHIMTQVEVRCAAKDLPEYIEVDLKDVDIDQIIHLSEIKLPKGVKLATEADVEHDLPVVSIHVHKAATEESAEDSEETEAQSNDSESATDN